ncbi:MAG: efflux RND transporter periplasmic adaptor subunit, partial [Calditrichia bacterium]|nr:efflux RND transporter periplasmic adaptor subunit [Calditrichia bacterium]
EYDRAKRLLEKDAISKRDFEGIEQIFLIHQAGIKPLLKNNSNIGSENFNTDDNHFFIASPINGIVSELAVLPGQNISYGQKIMTIINSSTVWLKLNIYEKDIYKIGEPQGAEINIPGLESPVVLTKNELKLVSKGEIVDPASRTIPVLIEVKNPNKLFKIGQALQVKLYTAEEKRALVVSKSAVIDEDVQKVVFIQTGGETFEKRIVKTGISNSGYVTISDGLQEGERVVTKGAYQVKLASLNTAVGSAHVH